MQKAKIWFKLRFDKSNMDFPERARKQKGVDAENPDASRNL
jgi:hypothetical protein